MIPNSLTKDEIKNLSPGVVCVVTRKYNEKGWMEPTQVRATIPAIIYPFRLRDESIPKGFNKYDIRGTDWSEVSDPEELLALCEQYREALKNHLTDEEYEECVAAIKEDEGCDEFYTLHSALNYAMEESGAPTIEGFEETMNEGVFVNHYETVIMKESIQKLRKRYGYNDNQEIDVEIGYVGENECPIWNEFICACNS